ncbi:hypothetical protein [Cellulomonas sp. SG140]|uniref:hypothetical protein n=1 Tax=Cellulomonas sp. SG140 TaxID=2976536 RepID=UPI0021E6E569|nr:hypothetical protein [Cellulomonas sp. SG140]
MIRTLANPRLRFIATDDGEGGGSTEEAPAAEATETSAEETGTEQEPAEGEESGKDAAWLTTELNRVRRESANYRTQLRAAQDALSKAKSPEEYEAAVKELSDKLAASETALVRERVATAHKLPAELAARLVGTTEEELVADAKALAKLIAAPAVETDPAKLRGGLDPSDDDDAFDPVATARKARTSRY